MPVQFNVSQLLQDPFGATRSYDLTEDAIDLDDSVARDVRGHVKFTHTNFGIMAQVEADAEMDLTCARCLEQFQGGEHVAFTEEYRPTIDILTGQPSAADAHSETVFEISENHIVDLTEALRQHFLLAMELIPICREDCGGLCPTCGVNLNNETCQCPPPEVTNPFAVLQGLLGETDRSETR
ncbi:MAG TPA: DUF177 domain-containing protein [Chloroflexota bacterium]|nr:DUF177 domain-containing protein [Chloroflexota bacterium]